MTKDEDEEFEEVEEPLLRLSNVTKDLVGHLKNAGYYTIASLAIESPHVLLERVGERKGFDLKVAGKIVREARAHMKVEIITAAELLEEEQSRQSYTTGSKQLDELLGGGIHEQQITDLTGKYETGKTEIILTAALLAAAQYKASSLIFDTEGSFSAKRLCEMAEARGLNVEETIPLVNYAKVYGTEHLVFLLQNAHKPIRERNIKLLAVDSLTSPFRAEYPGRELLAPRQQMINRCLQMLINYSRVYKLAVITTQQVLATPIAYTYAARPETLNPPVGGHVVSHRVHNRLYLRMGPGTTRIATLIASSYLPRAERVFRISEKGVEDVEESK